MRAVINERFQERRKERILSPLSLDPVKFARNHFFAAARCSPNQQRGHLLPTAGLRVKVVGREDEICK